MRTAALLIGALLSAAAAAQELEPRAYSNAPIGTSFLVLSATHLSGPVNLDPSLAAVDIEARVDVATLAYTRVFGLFGRSANFAVALPYIEADLRGAVGDSSREVHRAGPGDLHLRGAINLFGHAALTPAEFGKQPDSLAAGASLSVVAPTGQYESSRFINIVTNRWAFKPEVGVSCPFGNWFTEAAAGVWLFTDNHDFFGGQRRSQESMATYQLHAGYNFRRGLWLAGDYGRYVGGRTAVDGVQNDDAQHNTRVGLALAVPVSGGWSTKLAWSKGTIVRVGGDYRIVSLAVQYRWFD